MKKIGRVILIITIIATACDNADKSKAVDEIPGLKKEVSGNAEAGETAFALCATCHGKNAEGLDSARAPRLTGLSDWYMIQQLNNFKSGVRGEDPSDQDAFQMSAMAKTLATDQAVKDVVAYIKTLKNNPLQEAIEGDIANGKKYYTMVCGTCHGPEGKGSITFHAPNLRDQQLYYSLKQVEDFRKGRRGTHSSDIFGAQMQMISGSAPEGQSMIDIFAYLHSLNQTE